MPALICVCVCVCAFGWLAAGVARISARGAGACATKSRTNSRKRTAPEFNCALNTIAAEMSSNSGRQRMSERNGVRECASDFRGEREERGRRTMSKGKCAPPSLWPAACCAFPLLLGFAVCRSWGRQRKRIVIQQANVSRSLCLFLLHCAANSRMPSLLSPPSLSLSLSLSR